MQLHTTQALSTALLSGHRAVHISVYMQCVSGSVCIRQHAWNVVSGRAPTSARACA